MLVRPKQFFHSLAQGAVLAATVYFWAVPANRDLQPGFMAPALDGYYRAVNSSVDAARRSDLPVMITSGMYRALISDPVFNLLKDTGGTRSRI